MSPKIDKIIRTKRKTIALIVTTEAKLVVRAPLEVTDDYIKNLVHKKRLWIRKKQDSVRKKPKVRVKEFVNGESFLFLGKDHRLKIVKDTEKAVDLKHNLLIRKDVLPEARDRIKQWYKEQALDKITSRVEHYSRLIGLKPSSIKITNAEKRWGSCGPKKILNFSWRLVMAPIDVIDYVVVHELIHLEEKNHSKKFWKKLRVIMPDYEKRVNWFKENENLLKL